MCAAIFCVQSIFNDIFRVAVSSGPQIETGEIEQRAVVGIKWSVHNLITRQTQIPF